jgi:hypothetical protein
MPARVVLHFGGKQIRAGGRFCVSAADAQNLSGQAGVARVWED